MLNRPPSRAMTAESASSAPLALDRLPADVAAAEAIRPADTVDRRIGARLRLRHILAERGDIEHAATVGYHLAALGSGAGVKDLHALDLAGLVEPLDQGAALIISRITLGRHHHGQRRVRIPPQIEA